MAIHLSSSVTELPGIGTKGYKDLKAMGITSVRDLLLYVPFRYDDFSFEKPIGELKGGDLVTVEGVVESIFMRPTKNKHVQLVEAMIGDETGEIKVVWFNQKYLLSTLPKGTKISLAGEVSDAYGLVITNPVHEKAGERVHTGRIVPVYGLSGSLSMKRLRNAIKVALSAADEFLDWIPETILDDGNFSGLTEALTSIHFPDSQDRLDDAVDRLKFDELFLHQMLFAEIRQKKEEVAGHAIDVDEAFLKEFVSKLPFELTNAQRSSAWEIMQDLSLPTPMNRLLEGDVGSGKTVVAAMAAARVIHSGGQVLYLAPTEILAKQQYEALCSFLGSEKMGLFTRSHQYLYKEVSSKSELSEEIAAGNVSCIVGTHALLQDVISPSNLQFVIVDEQHRFGVQQRHKLLQSGKNGVAPHLLSMTATPIPRSLSLVLYGDLELSVLNEMPKGRLPVGTAIVTPDQIDGMWRHVKSEIEKKHQVFVVCPLIDPSDTLGTKSVSQVSKELSKGPLKNARVSMLHGKMKKNEKESVMSGFRDGSIDVLVSTTVVEVGVDIPNATTMVIMGANRFGLAQLHQLRGRVGRSGLRSYCYLLPDAMHGVAKQRLEALVASNDGFALAEKDLELRGPGNVFGNVQSGFPDFQLATPADVELMKKARDYATQLLSNDQNLEQYPLIREKTKASFDAVHLE